MSDHHGISDSPSSDTIREDPVTPAQLHSAEDQHEATAREGNSFNGHSDSESIRSGFSDSSSDGGQSPYRATVGVTASSPPVPGGINARGSNTETTPSSMSWEEFCNIDLRPMDDPDADFTLRTAIRLQEGGSGSLPPRTAIRLEQERSRGFDYDARPRSPLRWWGDELQLQSVRTHLGQYPSNFDNRHEPLRHHANGRESPLKKVRSVDDLSPESPEDEWQWFVEQAGLVETPAVEENEAPASVQDPIEEPLASAVWIDGPQFLSIEENDLADLPHPSDSEAEVPPQLHISTSHAANQNGDNQAPDQEPEPSAEERGMNEPPTPPSAEELQMMTRMSPDTSLEKLHEIYEHLKSSRFENPAETLKFKRQLIDCEQRRMKYNGLDDNLLQHVEYSADPSIVKMYTTMAAHIYRRQRDELRVQADEQYYGRKEAERLREEDAYEISMLKHELEIQGDKLQQERKALAHKTREASIWQTAYEKFAPIAKREFDRKERLENGEDVTKDIETQTEHLRVQSASTQTTDIVERANGKPSQESYNALTLENSTLRRTISEINTKNCNLIERNKQLEERLAGSNETWQALVDADLDVSEGKKYFDDLRAENTRLQDELTRLKALMESVKKWHEEREDSARFTSSVPTTCPPQAPPAVGGLMASIAASWDHEAEPMPLIFNPPQAWIDREARCRNTEGCRRTRDAILRHFEREREKRRIADELEFERAWRGKLAEMRAC